MLKRSQHLVICQLTTQSERLDLYQHHVRYLLEHDKAYECFCTPDELLSIRVSLHQQGQRHTYDGRCRHLSEEERGRRKKAGQKHVVRFKVSYQWPGARPCSVLPESPARCSVS
jgi:glutamyl-tRNA synthetase